MIQNECQILLKRDEADIVLIVPRVSCITYSLIQHNFLPEKHYWVHEWLTLKFIWPLNWQSWLSSYDSWIDSYLLNQCLSLLKFKSCSWWGFIYITLCGEVCQWFAAGLWSLWFPPLIKLTHDIIECIFYW